jgi:hypothetical protein
MNTITFDDDLMAQGFTQIPNVILEDGNITPQAKVLYQLLLRFAWKEDHAFPGQETLCDMMGFRKKDSVRKYLNELKELNLLDWKQRGLNKTNVYTILTRTTPRLEPQPSGFPETHHSGFPTIKKTQMNNTQVCVEPIVNAEETSRNDVNPTADAFQAWVEAKEARKANKGKWRQPSYQAKPDKPASKGTLEDSLRDNLPVVDGVCGQEVKDMAKRCRVYKKDVLQKKNEYIAWVMSKPNEQSRWGLDMKAMVEVFINRAVANGEIEQNIPLKELILEAGYEIAGENNENN